MNRYTVYHFQEALEGDAKPLAIILRGCYAKIPCGASKCSRFIGDMTTIKFCD